MAQIILLLVALYSVIGLLFAVLFVSTGITKVDPAAKGAPVLLLVLLLPGLAALWPVMLVHWRAGGGKGKSHDAP